MLILYSFIEFIYQFYQIRVESLRFSVYNIMPSANRERFTSSFPICMPFFSLLVLARNSSKTLNKSGKSRHSCLVLILNFQVYTIEFDVNCEFVIYDLYLVIFYWLSKIVNLFAEYWIFWYFYKYSCALFQGIFQLLEASLIFSHFSFKL